jgi:hypothetical protein
MGILTSALLFREISPLALHYQKIKGHGLNHAEHGQGGVRLPAVMRLVIEQVRKYLPDRLALFRATQCLILPNAVIVINGQTIDETNNSIVFRLARFQQ